VSSAFVLLALAAATNLTLVPLAHNTTSAQGAATTQYPYPPQCGLLSNNVYNFKLFFGFASIAVIFMLLRLGLVRQSGRLGGDDIERGRPQPDTVVAVPAATKVVVNEHSGEEMGRIRPKGAAVVRRPSGDEDAESDELRRERRRSRKRRHRRHRRSSHRRDSDDESSAEEEKSEKSEHSSN